MRSVLNRIEAAFIRQTSKKYTDQSGQSVMEYDNIMAPDADGGVTMFGATNRISEGRRASYRGELAGADPT
jgi:hypothetical protein